MLSRREIMAAVAGTGIGTALFHRAIAAQVDETEAEPRITGEMIKNAEWICGTEFTDDEREQIAKSLDRNVKSWESLRSSVLTADELPAVHFRPLVNPADRKAINIDRAPSTIEQRAPTRPTTEEGLAFLPVTELSALIRSGDLTSTELTQLYLNRLKRFAPMLKCVVNYTEDIAMEQAGQADREIAAGRYRGPLHGIPWGAKDLIAVPGYPTTWGIPQFKERSFPEMATVAQRLEQAGAVLIAKLSLGAIAMGDRWFEGMTRNPWNPKQGSSGSSAGSASATAAGCVGFTLGSETLGSIVSPSRRCGTTGHRPTFGRVSRHGCMPLSWTMDKIGPITRSVEDCALVFAAIHGADGLDPTVDDWSFEWPSNVDPRQLRVGYTHRQNGNEERQDLQILRELGCQLVEIELPNAPRMLTDVIDIEAASVFDDMLRDRNTEGWNMWPSIFRNAQFVSAIDYLRLLRHRRKLMFEMEEAIRDIDFLVNVQDLVITNLTGHPSVVMPRGFRERDGNRTPVSTIITGHLNDDARLLGFAHLYQQKLTAHLEQPPLEDFLKTFNEAEEEKEAKENDNDNEDGDK